MENSIQAAKAAIYKHDILQKGSIQITVNGNSMFPFLKNNDRIILNKAGLDQISIGDIVLTDKGNRLLCHRVFKKNTNSLRTKADALIYSDELAQEKDLIGKVVVIRSGKKTIRLNTNFAKYSGFLISRVMVIGAFLYIPLRLLRKIGRTLASFLSYQRQP